MQDAAAPTTTLAAIPGRDGARMNLEEPTHEPGTWWRVVPMSSGADANALPSGGAPGNEAETRDLALSLLSRAWDEGLSMPDHGLVLLLIEARHVDGLLHSLVLEPHPGWTQRYPVKMTLAQFERIMAPEPEGAELREREKARVMGRVQQLHADIGTPPDPADIARRVEQRKAEEARKAARPDAGPARIGAPAAAGPDSAAAPDASGSGAAEDPWSRRVPAALLPSQDIVAAEAALRHHILVAEVSREIIEQRIKAAGKGMAVVARYQEEVVATTLAGISRQRQQADQLLTSVHTMKLWLGDGIETHPVLDGSGCGPDEPIRFMQQLLYLDEEIQCAEIIEGGFSSDHLGSLPEMLRRNPGVIDAMLPYPRCVTIARLRRRGREFEAPTDLRGLFDMVDRMKEDMTILIFLRDGDRLTILRADDATSNANRLFPSRAEIDQIFMSKIWGEKGKVIDVSDVRYAEKRSEHDQVALFYKRFLLIIWGSHERDMTFGSLPRGMNWLTSDTHARYFEFIHDEELGLGDLSRPTISAWLSDLRSRVKPGSRAVLRWSGLLNQDAAPGAFSRSEHRDPEQIREPLRKRDIVEIGESEGELVAICESRMAHAFPQVRKTYRVTVRLAHNAANPDFDSPAIFPIDHMRSADIEFYLKNRKARQSYLDWVSEIRIAMPVVRDRERAEEALLKRILAARPGLSEGVRSRLPDCVHAAVLAHGWTIPPASADAGILAQAILLERGLPDDPEAVSRAIRANGTILRNLPAPMLFEGLIEEPFLSQQVLTCQKGGAFQLKSERMVPAWDARRIGDIPIGGADRPLGGSKALLVRVPTLQDRSWMEQILGNGAATNAYLDSLLAPSASDARDWVNEMLQINRSSRNRQVITTPMSRVIGFAVIPPDPRKARTSMSMWSLRMIRLHVDPVQHAWISGHKDEALRFGRIYAHPKALEERLHRDAGKPTIRVCLDGPASERSWRQAAERDPFHAEPAGFRDLEIRSWHVIGGDCRTVRFSFDRPDLSAALLRPVLRARGDGTQSMAEEDRKAWVATQDRIRVHLPDGTEERLLRIIGMFEPLPVPEASFRNGRPEAP